MKNNKNQYRIPDEQNLKCMMIIILAALLSLALFFYFQNQRLKRMEEHHERSKERFEKLLETLRKSGDYQKKDPDPPPDSHGDK